MQPWIRTRERTANAFFSPPPPWPEAGQTKRTTEEPTMSASLYSSCQCSRQTNEGASRFSTKGRSRRLDMWLEREMVVKLSTVHVEYRTCIFEFCFLLLLCQYAERQLFYCSKCLCRLPFPSNFSSTFSAFFSLPLPESAKRTRFS